jgi:hypothetical protein
VANSRSCYRPDEFLVNDKDSLPDGRHGRQV